MSGLFEPVIYKFCPGHLYSVVIRDNFVYDAVSNDKRADNLPTLIDYISILYYEVTHNLDIILYGFVKVCTFVAVTTR